MGAALLLALAGAIVFVLPTRWRRVAQDESTIDWLRLRQEELANDGDGESDALLADAQLRVLDEWDEPSEGGAGDGRHLAVGEVGAQVPSISPILGFVLAFILVVGSGLLYAALGALEDMHIAQQLDNVADSNPDTVPALIERIEARVAKRPGNSDYLSLLGEYYTAQERHGDALRVYTQLIALFPESPEVLARAAQADYLSRGRVLSSDARRWAESALAGDPDQRTALGTLGMAAFEAKDYGSALSYWERLLRFEAPGSPGHEMMASVIAEARRRSVDSGGVPQQTHDPLAGTEGVAVTVEAPEGASIPASATVFVIARPAGSVQRMPTAVVRLSAAVLPLNAVLNDASAMAGQQISALHAVDVEVQVSLTGQPGQGNASWIGKAANISVSKDAKVSIMLTRVSP